MPVVTLLVGTDRCDASALQRFVFLADASFTQLSDVSQILLNTCMKPLKRVLFKRYLRSGLDISWH